jgi:hypothetical protein
MCCWQESSTRRTPTSRWAGWDSSRLYLPAGTQTPAGAAGTQQQHTAGFVSAAQAQEAVIEPLTSLSITTTTSSSQL